MKVLITGAGGFIGRNLARRLKTKYELSFLDLQCKNLPGNCYEGSILDSELLKKATKVDVIIHLAALLDESAGWERLYDTNVEGTYRLLKASIENKVKKFIYLSTTGVHGNVKGIADENYPYNPETLYEETKCEAEKLVLSFMKATDMKITVLRSSLIVGANIYWKKILEKVKKGFPLLGSGKNKMHLTPLKDVLQTLELAMEKDKTGVYIIAGKDVPSYREIYKLLIKKYGVKEKSIPVWLANLLMFFWKDDIVKRSHIKRLIRERFYKVEKAKKELGFSPSSIRDSLQILIHDYGW